MARIITTTLIRLLILLPSPLICSAAEKISCAYPEKPSNIMVSAQFCGEINDQGLLAINKDILDNVNWNKYGMDCAYVYGTEDRNGWYFVSQTGKGRISPFGQDNDCAPFTEGLAVGLINGKVIYYNQMLEVVRRTDYVYASGFHQGYSKVCIGEPEKEYNGEHYQYKGGLCGYIDTGFKEVVPISHPYEKTPEPKTP